MDFLNVNSTGLVTNFINRYQIWKDCVNFSNNISAPYLICHDSLGIPCFHYTNIEAINVAENNIIAIDCLTEGIHSINYFKQYRTDRRYIIFANGWWDQLKFSLPFDYILIWNLFFLFEMCDTYNSPNRFCYYLNVDYTFDYPKPCMFISTTGNVREERDIIADLVQSKIKYENYIFRYSGQDLGQQSSQFDVIQFKIGEFDPYTSIIEKYYHNVSQSLPIELYNQSYFNLIVETDLTLNHSFFLTEKTIKSLIVGQPFVICASAHHLKHLRKLGFLTYDSLWNEEYDNITDFNQRMLAVIDLCNQLREFDWLKHREEFLKIKKHNRQLFNRLNSIANTEFTSLETIIKEL